MSAYNCHLLRLWYLMGCIRIPHTVSPIHNTWPYSHDRNRSTATNFIQTLAIRNQLKSVNGQIDGIFQWKLIQMVCVGWDHIESFHVVRLFCNTTDFSWFRSFFFTFLLKTNRVQRNYGGMSWEICPCTKFYVPGQTKNVHCCINSPSFIISIVIHLLSTQDLLRQHNSYNNYRHFSGPPLHTYITKKKKTQKRHHPTIRRILFVKP